MKIFTSLAFAALISLSANSAFDASATDLNRTITKIGTQQAGSAVFAYIFLSPSLSIAGGCQGGDIVYISDLASAPGKSFYATLLTAYSQGKPLSRIDYGNTVTGGLCIVTLLEVS